ncbi:hypothetical protein HII36_21930 [Nonomuraea sp. NN258]|uniref:hypothetical protein n=1 Tax=Nonomuraea antri TaxID=2730852 RepID=UPI0015695225|nr:hypothetical protein [Nonomuraea antri]NRQ34487.1 hypothetical protein [Nonomuraea antri]
MSDIFPNRSAYDEPGSIVMDAAELAMRFASGGRFRLVAMLDVLPSEPPRVAEGLWPRILFAEEAGDGRTPPILIGTEALPDESHEACPDDRVVVIPIPPEQAARDLELTARRLLDA